MNEIHDKLLHITLNAWKLMQSIDTLLHARWIIPIEPQNVLLEHHAIAIDNGRIEAILPSEQAQHIYKANNTIKLNEHVVLPGLINMHTHSPMALFRGKADDLPLMEWLEKYIWPAEQRWMSDEFCYDGTQLAILEMLRSGTTCFNDNYFFVSAIAQAASDAYMRANIGAGIINFPSSYAKGPDEYIAKAVEIYKHWQNHPLINISISPHAPYTVSDETFLKINRVAHDYNMLIHLHLHETKEEVKQSLQEYNKRPLKRIDDLGLTSNKLQCVHMTDIDEDDVLILQKSHAHVIHCPESNLKLNSGLCRVQKLIGAGVNVSIGTDGAASNNDLDMFAELRTTSILAKITADACTAVDAMTTLRMATINGAKALRLDHEIGSLEAGKAADIIAVDLNHANTQPVYNPISHLVYAVNSRQVSDVWIAGKHLLKNGQFTYLDEKEILNKAKNWRQKILQV